MIGEKTEITRLIADNKEIIKLGIRSIKSYQRSLSFWFSVMFNNIIPLTFSYPIFLD